MLVWIGAARLDQQASRLPGYNSHYASVFANTSLFFPSFEMFPSTHLCFSNTKTKSAGGVGGNWFNKVGGKVLGNSNGKHKKRPQKDKAVLKLNKAINQRATPSLYRYCFCVSIKICPSNFHRHISCFYPSAGKDNYHSRKGGLCLLLQSNCSLRYKNEYGG